jgi:hypothetical protein
VSLPSSALLLELVSPLAGGLTYQPCMQPLVRIFFVSEAEYSQLLLAAKQAGPRLTYSHPGVSNKAVEVSP